MGHRALVAYERTDGTYNLHYTHWGGLNLRLARTITEATPYGGGCTSQALRETYQALVEGVAVETIDEEHHIDDGCSTDVEQLPLETGVTLEATLTDHLDYLIHEAFYVVDREFEVTAYRTLWFGLQYEAESVESQPTIGFGAVRTVRWHNGEPVDDGYARGQFAGMKRIIAKMVDRGVFDAEAAIHLLKQEVIATTDSNRGVQFGRLESHTDQRDE